jgi:putative membrane protein
MARLTIHWILSAVCLLLVASFMPGFYVSGFGTALIAALLIGFINGTVGFLLKIITFPLTVVTFGLFWFVINALMLMLASAFLSGFEVRGFASALIGSLILSLLNLFVRAVV